MVVDGDLNLSPESIADFGDVPYVPAEGSAAAEPGKENPGDGAPAGEPAAIPGVEKAAPADDSSPTGNDNQLSPYWQKLQKDITAIDPEYKLPEILTTKKKEDGTPITPEEEFDLLREEIYKHTEDPYADDPFIGSYLAAKESPEFDEAKWIAEQAKAYNFITAPAKSLVLEAFRITNEKESKGWTEENIQAFVDGMNPIDLELKADSIRNAYRGNLAESQRNSKILEQQKYTEHIQTKTQENIALAKATFTEVEKISSLGGVPHGEPERAEFQPVYEKLVTINPETGNAYALDLLMDNQTLYKALYLLHATDKGLISNFKEDFKAETLSKMDVNKNSNKGGAANVAIDVNSDEYL